MDYVGKSRVQESNNYLTVLSIRSDEKHMISLHGIPPPSTVTQVYHKHAEVHAVPWRLFTCARLECINNILCQPFLHQSYKVLLLMFNF